MAGALGVDRAGGIRKILHLDMDAFFAAIEQRDDPQLRGRPIAVGGRSRRGVVMTASYEARVFGVRSAMPTATALRLCPELVVVPPRFDAYQAASRTIRALMTAWTPLVEPLSLDEAYLDVTAPLREALPAVEIARRLKAEILAATGLTASAGVSFNKVLAKLASDLEKPDGLTLIRPRDALAFLAGLPVERLHGVGPATARRLARLGIATGADLQAAEPQLLEARLGRLGVWLSRLARGHDDRPVRPDRPRRSLSVERTLETDVAEAAALDAILDALALELERRLAASGFRGRTLVLKIKTDDFRVRTRSLTVGPYGPAGEALGALARQLLRRPQLPPRPVRLLGLGIAAPGREDQAADQLRLPV